MTILIVEDEPKTARLLRELILEQTGREVVGICESVQTAVQWLETKKDPPGLIFMDIHLADGISFDIFKRTKVRSPVVFCTAYEDYTLQAFRAGGIAYILKPFREEDIATVFERIEQIRHIDVPGALGATFLIRSRDKIYPVASKDIALVALENEVTYLYTFDQQKHPLFKGIEEIEAALDPAVFFRINRRMILGRQAIKTIEPLSNRKVKVLTKISPAEDAVVSRLRVTDFLHWVEHPVSPPV